MPSLATPESTSSEFHRGARKPTATPNGSSVPSDPNSPTACSFSATSPDNDAERVRRALQHCAAAPRTATPSAATAAHAREARLGSRLPPPHPRRTHQRIPPRGISPEVRSPRLAIGTQHPGTAALIGLVRATRRHAQQAQGLQRPLGRKASSLPSLKHRRLGRPWTALIRGRASAPGLVPGQDYASGKRLGLQQG